VSVLIFEGGFEAANCDSAGRHVHTTLYYWYYVFYLSKIYEFIDTIILCLKQVSPFFEFQFISHFMNLDFFNVFD